MVHVGQGSSPDIKLLEIRVRAKVPDSHADEIAEEMDARLRREFQQLGRIVIHTEPYPVPKTSND
jgi:divalent metal cation (Fe/Co/Zn/Cd) transporter